MLIKSINFNTNISKNRCKFFCRDTSNVIEPTKMHKETKELLSNITCDIVEDTKKMENLHLLFENISYHFIDINYNIIHTSGISKPGFFIESKKIVNKKIHEIYPKEYSNFLIDLLNIVKNTKKDFHIILHINKHPYEVSIIPILSRANILYGYVFLKTPYSLIEFLKKDAKSFSFNNE